MITSGHLIHFIQFWKICLMKIQMALVPNIVKITFRIFVPTKCNSSLIANFGVTIMISLKSRKKPASLKRKRQHYVIPLFDDCGHPIPQEDWECMLPELKARRLLRKRKNTSPPIQDIDPAFGE